MIIIRGGNMKHSLRSQKFAISAAMATLGTSIMLLFPWNIVAYTVGPATMMCVIVILLFGKNKEVNKVCLKNFA